MGCSAEGDEEGSEPSLDEDNRGCSRPSSSTTRRSVSDSSMSRDPSLSSSLEVASNVEIPIHEGIVLDVTRQVTELSPFQVEGDELNGGDSSADLDRPPIYDSYSSEDDELMVTAALRKDGLNSCNLIVAIDFTISNEWTGDGSFSSVARHLESLLMPCAPKNMLSEMAIRNPGLIALFGVDGTLTAPRKVVTPMLLEFMRELRKEFISFTLHYIADLDIPIKSQCINFIIQGKHSFNNRSLHAIGVTPNPYEKVISIIGKNLAPFNEDKSIPCFGFGDGLATTYDQEVFSFQSVHSPCQGFEEVVTCYRKIVPNVRLGWPTSYGPVIEAAIDIVEKSGGKYHVLLLIISDSQVTSSVNTSDLELSPQEWQTINSIDNASSYPLSIVLVGVGDGPWDDMTKFEDKLPARELNNFQCVNFTEIMNESKANEREAAFALAALTGLPLQYKAAMEFGIVGRVTGRGNKINPRPPPDPYTYPLPTEESSNRSSTIADEENSMTCPICLTNARDMAFNCGHLTCKECGPQVHNCPICRQPIIIRVKLHI